MIQMLIDEALKVLGVLKFNSYYRNYSGRVACALITNNDNVFTGVSVDLVCGLGNCAEYSAICEMVKHHETRIKMIVSIYEGGKIIPPCGRCRELITQVDINNADSLVILDTEKTVKLKELLPLIWNN